MTIGRKSFRNVAVRHNIFDGRHPALVIFAEDLQRFDINNNLLNSRLPIDLGGHWIQGDFVVRNNLNQRPGLLGNHGPRDPSKQEWLRHWQVDHNCYSREMTGKEGMLDRLTAPDNTMTEIRFLSRVPNSPDYLRVNAADPIATQGAGGEWPGYVGALPPGPAPKEGDWFTRITERSMK